MTAVAHYLYAALHESFYLVLGTLILSVSTISFVRGWRRAARRENELRRQLRSKGRMGDYARRTDTL